MSQESIAQIKQLSSALVESLKPADHYLTLLAQSRGFGRPDSDAVIKRIVLYFARVEQHAEALRCLVYKECWSAREMLGIKDSDPDNFAEAAQLRLGIAPAGSAGAK
jgi:hypothetical protein